MSKTVLNDEPKQMEDDSSGTREASEETRSELTSAPPLSNSLDEAKSERKRVAQDQRNSDRSSSSNPSDQETKNLVQEIPSSTSADSPTNLGSPSESKVGQASSATAAESLPGAGHLPVVSTKDQKDASAISPSPPIAPESSQEPGDDAVIGTEGETSSATSSESESTPESSEEPGEDAVIGTKGETSSATLPESQSTPESPEEAGDDPVLASERPARGTKASITLIHDTDIEEEAGVISLAEDPLEVEELEDEEEEEDKEGKGKTLRKRQSQSRKKQYTEDSIRLYLQEIGRIRLLRADEEIELARKIADLLELERIRDQIADQQNLSSPEEVSEADWAAKVGMSLADFRRRLLQGRRAKDKMVQSNLRLVVSIAKKYMNRGLSFQDLIQEGSLGLIRAAEKFDHEKGYKFSTYATWWIRQAITRAIADQSRTIRLPVHLYETISRIKKTTKLLSQEMGRKPTEEEIADRMEMTIEKLRFIAKSAQLPISLETPIGKEEDSRLGDFIESEGETPDEQVAKALLKEQLEEVLSTLSPRERDVLRLRYGLDDGRMKTLEEIGQIFNVTRERIRQIEAKALRKLRHPNRNSILKEYIR